MASYRCRTCGRTNFFTSHGLHKHEGKCARRKGDTVADSRYTSVRGKVPKAAAKAIRAKVSKADLREFEDSGHVPGEFGECWCGKTHLLPTKVAARVAGGRLAPSERQKAGAAPLNQTAARKRAIALFQELHPGREIESAKRQASRRGHAWLVKGEGASRLISEDLILFSFKHGVPVAADRLKRGDMSATDGNGGKRSKRAAPRSGSRRPKPRSAASAKRGRYGFTVVSFFPDGGPGLNTKEHGRVHADSEAEAEKLAARKFGLDAVDMQYVDVIRDDDAYS